MNNITKQKVNLEQNTFFIEKEVVNELKLNHRHPFMSLIIHGIF